MVKPNMGIKNTNYNYVFNITNIMVNWFLLGKNCSDDTNTILGFSKETNRDMHADFKVLTDYFCRYTIWKLGEPIFTETIKKYSKNLSESNFERAKKSQ